MLRLINAKLERMEGIFIRLKISRNFDLEGNFTTFILLFLVIVLVLEGIT